MDINTRALPLLAIADHAARKTESRFGALVGVRRPGSITVTDAFDIRHDADSLDVKFLGTKLALLQAVAPSTELVGFYSCDGSSVPLAFCRQAIVLGHTQALIYMVPGDAGSFRCYFADTMCLVPYTLIPGASEVTAVTTVQNHANYSLKEADLIRGNEHSGPSFRQLEERMVEILAHVDPGPLMELHLVYLAQLVLRFHGASAPQHHEAQLAYLSLLAAQIAAVQSANAQTRLHTASIDKRGHRPALN